MEDPPRAAVQHRGPGSSLGKSGSSHTINFKVFSAIWCTTLNKIKWFEKGSAYLWDFGCHSWYPPDETSSWGVINSSRVGLKKQSPQLTEVNKDPQMVLVCSVTNNPPAPIYFLFFTWCVNKMRTSQLPLSDILQPAYGPQHWHTCGHVSACINFYTLV